MIPFPSLKQQGTQADEPPSLAEIPLVFSEHVHNPETPPDDRGYSKILDEVRTAVDDPKDVWQQSVRADRKRLAAESREQQKPAASTRRAILEELLAKEIEKETAERAAAEQ